MDWLSDTSPRNWRIGISLLIGVLVAVGLMLFMRGGINGSTFVILLLVSLAVTRAIRGTVSRRARHVEKRKHEDFAEDDDKVKREPTYVLGDDGELIPVDELEEKPKHSEYL
ncbi:MAG: hypothetical protein J0M07_13175 [Anaerolineae bacterium]|nr:hypothetical protein [Anaerolineae bacterium]